MVLDENLVEVDLVTLASGVSVTRMRGDVTEQLNSVTGFTTIPNDVLEFSIPVRNRNSSSPLQRLKLLLPMEVHQSKHP